MSWLLNSLVGNPPPDDEDDDDDVEEEDGLVEGEDSDGEDDSSKEALGLRDDLTELQQSLSKHWRGVASFLTGEPRRQDTSTPEGSRSARAISNDGADNEGVASARTEAPAKGSQDGFRGSSTEESLEDPTEGMSRDEIRSLRWRQELSRQSGKAPKSHTQSATSADVSSADGSGTEHAPDGAEGAEGAEKGDDAGRYVKMVGVKEDLAELSKRVTRGLTSVIRVVTGDDVAGSASAGGTSAPGATGGQGTENRRTQRSLSENEEIKAENSDDDDEDDDDSGETLLQAAQEDIKVLSNTLASGITGVSRFASRFFATSDDDFEGSDGGAGILSDVGGPWGEGGTEAVGVTEDVVQFAHNLSGHPETWIEFPLPDEEDEEEDFVLTSEHEEHVEAVEYRVPRLVALRMELTPQHLSERRFWKIYFVLLHSRIPPAAAAQLSTPPILRARDHVLSALRKQSTAAAEGEGLPAPKKAVAPVEVTAAAAAAAAESAAAILAVSSVGEPSSQQQEETPHAGDSAITPLPSVEAQESATCKTEASTKVDDDADDDWLDEESGGAGASLTAGDGGEDAEDVSFSDLEDEDDEQAGGTAVEVPAAAPAPAPAARATLVDAGSKVEENVDGSDDDDDEEAQPAIADPATAAAGSEEAKEEVTNAAAESNVGGVDDGDAGKPDAPKKEGIEAAGAGVDWVDVPTKSTDGGGSSGSENWLTVGDDDVA